MISQTSVVNADHVLLQHKSHIVRRTNNDISSRSEVGHFLFDAGTSMFDSSLWWFTCMYGQMNVTFDEIYGWEATLLEPSAFWREVPPALRAKYHFYDTYMEANVTNGNSPLRMIKQIARQNDFVAFKLDIDTPKVEIPTALEILNNPELTTLIDEFFF